MVKIANFVWLLIKLNVQKHWRIILIIFTVAGLTWTVTTCENRGVKIDLLETTIAELDTLIGRKDDTLSVLRVDLAGLQIDTTRLQRQLDKKQIDLQNANAKLSAGELSAAQADQAIEAGKRKVDHLTGQLSTYKLKEAADAGLRRNNMTMPLNQPLLVTDTATNSRFVRMAGYIQVYHDSTQSLKRVVGQQKETIRQQSEVITSQGEHISELEAIERGLVYTINKEVDVRQAEHHPLGWGQKKGNERLRRRLINAVTPKPLGK